MHIHTRKTGSNYGRNKDIEVEERFEIKIY